MTFGKALFIARHRAQMTQRELASAVDVDFTYISKLENERCETMPSEALVDRLAMVLEQDRDEWIRLARPDDVALLKERVAVLEAALEAIANDAPDEEPDRFMDQGEAVYHAIALYTLGQLARKVLDGGA